jgi:hypothetical protein
VSRFSLIALTIWALCFGITACGSAKVQGPQSGEMKSDEPAATVVTLTQDRPSNSLPIKALGGSTSDAEVLEISITKVINTSLTPITIDVYLSESETGKSEPSRHLIGNFSLYPPDQPGKFLLNAKTVLQEVPQSDRNAKAHDVRLIFEMKRVDESKAWTPVELGIAQPVWRKAEK